MTESEAKEFCVTKWEHIVDNEGSPGNLYVDNPKLRDFVNGCAYCTLYIDSKKGKFRSCYKCPLRGSSNNYKPLRVGCEQESHPYKAWNRLKTTATAQAVLDLINDN